MASAKTIRFWCKLLLIIIPALIELLDEDPPAEKPALPAGERPPK